MTRSQADNWSLARSLAFLAATFAIVIGTLLPYGVMAAARPGEPSVMCTAQGPLIVQVGGEMDGPAGKSHLPKCAACVIPLTAPLPTPPLPETCAPAAPIPEAAWVATAACPSPPARAPPRPPSTAPPLA